MVNYINRGFLIFLFSSISGSIGRGVFYSQEVIFNKIV